MLSVRSYLNSHRGLVGGLAAGMGVLAVGIFLFEYMSHPHFKPLPALPQAAKILAVVPQPPKPMPRAVSRKGDLAAMARAIHPKDAALVAWLTRWQQEFANKQPVSDEERKELAGILAKTPASATQILQLGNACFDVSKDLKTCGTFYVGGLNYEHRDLSAMGRGSKEAYALLLASGPAKSRLWTYFETRDNVDAGVEPALKARYEDSIKYVKPGDEKMAFTLYHGYIGLMECLELEGNLDEGIKVGESADTSQMTDDERSLTDFMLGTLYFEKKNYDAAAVPLERIAAGPKCRIQDRGMELLIQNYSVGGQKEKAEKVYQEYVAKFSNPLAASNGGENSNE